MAKKEKFNIHNMDKLMADVQAQTDTAENPVRVSISSPLQGRSVQPGAIKREQILYMKLPVTKRDVECFFVELDPDRCTVSPLNKRVQSLLSNSDPAIQKLVDSIRTEGQRDPVLVRAINMPGEAVCHEIVYGSRRRYAVSQLNQEMVGQGGLRLKAWAVSGLTDIDAERLAESENEDREAISPWEMAQHYSKVAQENSDKNAAVIAGMLGISRQSLQNYLVVAALPESLVRLVVSPSCITVNAALKIAKEVGNRLFHPEGASGIARALEAGAPYKSVTDLLAAAVQIRQQLKPKALPLRGVQVISSQDKNTKIAVSKHRERPNSYIAKLEGVSDELLAKIMALLKGAVG